MNELMTSAELDATMPTGRAQAEIARVDSVEKLPRDTTHDVLALMALDVRTPDEVVGSIYGRIASGQTSARLGNREMDAACVVHSDYAWHWVQHAECEEFGMTPARIAGCEIMELIA